MLSELADRDSSEEIVTGTSLSVETFEETDGGAVKREYEFTYGEEWDQWNFSEYTEYESETRVPLDWKVTTHMMWHDSEATNFSVPGPVVSQLREILSDSPESFK